jgi:D-alanine-D-alanine ligase
VRILVLGYLDEDRFDPVVTQVAKALERLGHEVSKFGVRGDIRALIAEVEKKKPELVFNLLEQFNEDQKSDVASVGLLDLLRVPYTGGGPGEFYLAGDKGLQKKVLAFEGISFPRFIVFSKDASFETGGKLRMPLFVKPMHLDASVGIDSGALVNDSSALFERVTKIHRELQDDAIAEEYIEGREIYVAIVGNADPIALPPIEVDFTGFPKDKPRVLDTKAKWDKKSAEYAGTKAVIAKLPDELAAKLKKISLEAYRAVRVRDYGRVDLRLTDSGEIYVIEVNASCYLEKDSELAMAAKAAGLSYDDLVGKIVTEATGRNGNGKRRRSRQTK